MKKKLIYFWRYWFWTPNILFVVIYIRRKFNLVLEKDADPIPKPPFIMISNHATFFDPWIVGHYSRHPLSIMMNDEGFRAGAFTQWYLKNIGTFPKKKGASDFRAMKTTLKRLGDGYPILIFPEGQTSWDGETQPIFPGTEKIVKKSNVSLVMTHISGNFLSKPWWAETFRKGTVRISRKVLHPDYIKTLSENELLDIMIKYIYQNDIKDKQNLKTEFTGKNLTAGLVRFVWMCKNCKSEDTLITDNNTISCTICNSSWSMDSHFRFKPLQPETAVIGDLYDWSLWHKEMIMNTIHVSSEEEVMTESNDVIYGKTTENGAFITRAQGKLSLTKQSLTFQAGTGNNQSFQLPVEEITEYVFQRKDIFECYCNDTSYRFRFIGHSLMKWVYYLRYLKGYDECEKRGYL